MKKILNQNIFTISNLISFVRLLAVIPLIILLSQIDKGYNIRIYLILLLVLIVISDNLDGYLARKFNQITELGKILDPLSDKIIIFFVALFMFFYSEIPASFFILILFKDLYIICGGIYIFKKTTIVPSSNIVGKIAAFTVGAFLTWNILDTQKNSFFYYSFYYISIFMIIASICAYSYHGIKTIKRS